MSKKEWKETGKEMGDAFSSLGKNIIRSTKTSVDKATDWAEDKEAPKDEKNVFNDGSWRRTGKKLGGAFKAFGKSIAKTTREGVDKATDWAEDGKKEKKAEAEKAEEIVVDKVEDAAEAAEEEK